MLLILHDDLSALGTTGGGNIGWCDKRDILSAQKFRISEKIRRSGFPALRQPIDSIVTLQGPLLHLPAAVWTNHVLTLSVPVGLRLSGTPMPAPLGAAPPPCGGEGGIGPAVPPAAARRVRIQGGCNPPWKGFNTSARPSRAQDDRHRRPGSPDARTPPCHPRATRSRSRRSWSWAAP